MRSNGGRTNRHWTHLSGSLSSLVVFRRIYLPVYNRSELFVTEGHSQTTPRYHRNPIRPTGAHGETWTGTPKKILDSVVDVNPQPEETCFSQLILAIFLIVCLSISYMFNTLARPISIKARGGYWTICWHLWSKLISNQASWSTVREY